MANIKDTDTTRNNPARHRNNADAQFKKQVERDSVKQDYLKLVESIVKLEQKKVKLEEQSKQINQEDEISSKRSKKALENINAELEKQKNCREKLYESAVGYKRELKDSEKTLREQLKLQQDISELDEQHAKYNSKVYAEKSKQVEELNSKLKEEEDILNSINDKSSIEYKNQKLYVDKIKNDLHKAETDKENIKKNALFETDKRSIEAQDKYEAQKNVNAQHRQEFASDMKYAGSTLSLGDAIYGLGKGITTAIKDGIDTAAVKIDEDLKDYQTLSEEEQNNQKNEFLDVFNDIKSTIAGYADSMVNAATSTVENNYGRLAGALEGVTTGLNDYKSVTEQIEDDLGISGIVKTTDMINQIGNLAASGITTDLESLALLETIKDKTVSSFSVTDSSLRRLVRLNENKDNLTAKQFGLADALKESFNETFGDTTFLNSLYQGLTSSVMDAVSANSQSGNTDSTGFYSIIEGWLGAMYEAGVSESAISSIANGINLLGSGNVSQLSSNSTLQNLLLLSVDRAGLDYAQILQSGLSDSDTNAILQEIVEYLAEITEDTSENNVLQSAYANLFNLSISDITAIQNLAKSGYTANYITGDMALSQAIGEVNNVKSRTAISEKIDNIIANAQWSFGSSIAESTAAYTTYKVASTVSNLLNGITSVVGDTGATVIKGIKLASDIAYLGSLIPGVVGFGSAIVDTIQNASNGTQGYLGYILNNGVYSGDTSYSSSTTSSSNFKQFNQSNLSSTSGITDTTEWENDIESQANATDPIEDILKEFEKTLMAQSGSEDHYAFAVSLQGMSDGVLRSFASIFADEDSMMNTLTGSNNALSDNNTFIEYAEDTTTKTVTS